MATVLPFGATARAGLAAALLLTATACGAAPRTVALTDPSSPLALERTVALLDVKGRIDHLAVDAAGGRLFVAEVANGSVDVIDLRAGKAIGRVGGLHEPQGIAWLPATREFVVACGDGSVHFYAGDSRRETGRVMLDGDADNVRVDTRNGHVVVGYGSGGLATIDPATHRVLRRLTFRGHPEGFRLSGGKAFVNVPDDGSVLSVDLDGGRVVARWPTGASRLNFPMAVDPAGRWIEIAFRLPATLARLDTATGKVIASRSTCGDSDDLFVVGGRSLIVCGAGHVDVVDGDAVTRVATSSGARTGLYVPELDTLFIAAPARGHDAAILQLRPKPVR